MKKGSIIRGDLIKIISMKGESTYKNRVGVVDHIDSDGQIHGSWGGCAIMPEEDVFKVVPKLEVDKFIESNGIEYKKGVENRP